MTAEPTPSPADRPESRPGAPTSKDDSTSTPVRISIDDPRVYLAAERTLLAWIRTGVALIGLGFLVAKFGLFLRELAMLRYNQSSIAGNGADQPLLVQEAVLPDWIGGGIVVLGALLTLLAGLDHMRMIRRLGDNDFVGHRRRYLSGSLTIVTGIIGILLAVYLLLL